MAQCFRDLGEAGHAARYARRSLDIDSRYVRGRAFNLSLLATDRRPGGGWSRPGAASRWYRAASLTTADEYSPYRPGVSLRVSSLAEGVGVLRS
jgi:hypothetical protein